MVTNPTPQDEPRSGLIPASSPEAVSVTRYARKNLRSLIAILRMVRSLILRKDSYLYSTGFHLSLAEKRPCDARGADIPWMNYSFVSLLNERLSKDLDIFEYGSGASTRFFSTRCASVTSCEHDREWYDKVLRTLPDNAHLMLKPADKDGHYCRAIRDAGAHYDVVLIDGLDRNNCLTHAVDCLSDRGVIILDDSHRERYRPLFSVLADAGFRCLTIEGLKPLQKRVHSTTVFYRDGNCMKI